MSNNYKVHKEVLKSINYDVLVLVLPENDIEDHLTQFVTERGQISKSLYEDFIIANCIANLNQFMAFIKTLESVDMIKLREEITKMIIKHNPLLDPDNIIINRNKVLKVKKDGEEGLPLTKNDWWNKNIYSNNHVDKKPKPNTNTKKKSTDINNLNYEETKIWWDRINEYISVKKFSSDDIDAILTEKYFHSRNSFNTYIVSTCVVEVEALYERIEGMGVSVAPIKIISELFDLCVGVNNGISYERAQDLQPDNDVGDGSSGGANQKRARTADKAATLNKKNKSKNKASFKKVTKEDLKNLSSNMKLSLIGQNEAVEVVSESIKRASVGLKDPVKPIGSFLFAGRTGCGKTLASKILADELIKTRKNRVVIDCSEYSSQHEYSKLIGAPSGYIGHDNGGVLTNAVLEDPFSVVVFDEIEKASSNVFDLMLQILDEGRLTDGKGNAVSFRETIIIMTSNIGVSNIDEIEKTIGFGDVAKVNEKNKKSAIDKALKKKFKPEFLNRLDSVVFFKDLDKNDYMKIIDIELNKLTENLKNNDTEYKDIKISFDKKVKNFIFNNGVDDKYGARPIKRAIEKEISSRVATVLLDHDCDENTEILVTIKRNNVHVEITQKEAELISPKSKYLNGNG